ncbi:MAG: AsmA family protein, partial [Candidatus Binatia bacterium]
DLNNLPLEGDLELEPVPLATLDKTVPGFKQSLPPGLDLAGAVGAKARFSGSFGKNSLPQINGTLNLANVSARIPQLPQPITDVNAKINFTGKSAELPESSFRIGKSQIRLAANVTGFTPLNIRYRLFAPELNLADLRAGFPGHKKPEIIKDLKSEGTVLIQNGVLTHRGNLNSPSGTIADGDYTNLQASTTFANRVLTIEGLSLGAFGGALSARGRYDMREKTPRFAATTHVKGMDLTQMFRSLLPSAPQNIQGQINMDLDVAGAGREREAIQQSLKGQGRAEVINGVLRDVNLADSVLSNTGIPGFASIVPADLKRKYPEVFSSKNTEFKQLKGSAIIKGGKAYTDDLTVAAAEFESRGKGWFAFDQTVDLRGQLLLSQAFSQDIISRARETKGLANDQGRIEIPFTMSGRLPGAKPKPDLGYIAHGLQKGAFDRGLDSFFRRRSRGSETAPLQPDQPSGSREREKRSPADEIRRGLEELFGR